MATIVAQPLLQSRDHTELLDTVDLLRSHGISRYVSIPQIVVCGDQSSGKSSVLEAISGVRFPTKDTLCTRFATELVLRRSNAVHVSISINTGPDRNNPDGRTLPFQYDNVKLEDIPNIIEKATTQMGIGPNEKSFSDNVLRVELSGPNQPHLTLVDLPGLIHSTNSPQKDDDIALVQGLVESYMANPRSIILAVVTAKNDISNQIVIKMVRKSDPHGHRTLGIITKPDTLSVDSGGEKDFVKLAKNEENPLRLGWHVLRNRTFEENRKNATAEERDSIESNFFAQGVWTNLPSNCLGVASLRPRLSNILKDQIILELPNLIRDVQVGIEDCEIRISNLGQVRGTIQEQELYLINISQSFKTIIKAAVDGIYVDEFFGESKTRNGYNKRLRAVIQDHLSKFREDMDSKGKARTIIDDEEPSYNNGPRPISRKEFIQEVRGLMIRTRGRELPGLFNPLIVGELFHNQSKPWAKLIESHRAQILESIRVCIDLVLMHVADESTRRGLERHIFGPTMDRYVRELDDKISEIIKPYQMGHPITYNEEFTNSVKAIRNDHARRETARRLKDFFDRSPDTSPGKITNHTFDLLALLNALTVKSEEDMELYACSEAVDFMTAYYKSALQVLVDNFATLAIEKCLVERLCDMFTPDMIRLLGETVIQDIAAEPKESQIERARLSSKLNSLRKGLAILQTLTRHRLAVDGTSEEYWLSVAGAVDSEPRGPEADNNQKADGIDNDHQDGEDQDDEGQYEDNGTDEEPQDDQIQPVYPKQLVAVSVDPPSVSPSSHDFNKPGESLEVSRSSESAFTLSKPAPSLSPLSSPNGPAVFGGSASPAHATASGQLLADAAGITTHDFSFQHSVAKDRGRVRRVSPMSRSRPSSSAGVSTQTGS